MLAETTAAYFYDNIIYNHKMAVTLAPAVQTFYDHK
jgi:hypothetical protein